MPVYAYQVRDSAGNVSNRTIEAKDAKEAEIKARLLAGKSSPDEQSVILEHQESYRQLLGFAEKVQANLVASEDMVRQFIERLVEHSLRVSSRALEGPLPDPVTTKQSLPEVDDRYLVVLEGRGDWEIADFRGGSFSMEGLEVNVVWWTVLPPSPITLRTEHV